MKLIKLNAIDSTNDFLKKLYRNNNAENFTVVLAKNQTNGKGQMGLKWNVEKDKNLTFSILCKNINCSETNLFDFNVLISVAVFYTLTNYNIPNLTIKWPNDIMAEGKKIGGILIENTIKSKVEIDSIIGIGININQEKFANLPNAASLFTITNTYFEIEKIAIEIVNSVKNLIDLNDYESIWEKYHHELFKKNVPIVFEDQSSTKFMGIIDHVSKDGKLNVKLENDIIKSFSLKEIKMIL